jgi:ABC-type uncharacterized transport system substrate-binding protein
VRRRDFFGLLAGSALIFSRTARGQQRERKRTIGMISGFDEREMTPLRKALMEKFEELGWREGENLEFDLRLTGGNLAAIAEAARSMVQRAPDVIIAQGSPVLKAVQQNTGTVPTVFLLVADPVGQGFIQSLAHPGGHLTGFTNFEISVGSKWVDLLKQVSSGIRRILLIASPGNPTTNAFSRQIEGAARSVDIDAETVHVRDAPEIESAIRASAAQGQAALITLPDFLPVVHRDLIVRLTREFNMPNIHPFRTFPANGGLMSYGLDYPDLYRQAAVYTDRILRGTKPADLPVQAPNKFELVINAKAAKALGLELSPALQASADEIID